MDKNKVLKLGNIKLQNTMSLLEILREHGAVSRVELARKLNCDGTTITRITRDLIGKGLLKTLGLADSTGGRPRELIELNADWKHAIGIGLDPDFIIGTIVDLRGKVLVREQIFLGETKAKKEFVNALALITERLLSSCDRDKLLGIAVAAFGTFSGKEKILEKTAGFPELEKFDINQFFESRYSITPEIIDISISKILYEIWFGKHGTRGNFLLITAGTGIGCVTAIDGKVVFSKYSHAGEFGHSIYQPDGIPCACGRKGCLETLCSINAILRKAREKLKKKNLKFQDIIKFYSENNPQITEIVNHAGRWLGIAIANQINSLAPDEIVITGETLKLGDAFYKLLLDTISAYTFPVFLKDLKITKTPSGEESTSIGAASILIRGVFEDSEQLKNVM